MSRLLAALRAHHTPQLAAVGALAGVASPLPVYLVFALGQFVDGGTAASLLFVPLFGYFLLGGPGLVFGLSVRAYLIRKALIAVEEAHRLVALSAMSMAAVAVILVFVRAGGGLKLGRVDWVDPGMLAFGMVGALGAAILVVALRAALGFFRNWPVAILTIAGCGASSVAFWREILPVELSFFLYFGLWQAVFAAGLSFGLERQAPDLSGAA